MRAFTSRPCFHRIAGIAMLCALCAPGLPGQLPAKTDALGQRGQAAQSGVSPALAADVPAITEDELKQQLLGKTLYLRGGWLGNPLHFDENGRLEGTSPQGSFTLSLVQITGVHLAKHRLELEAVRYGLHFLGALPTEEQSNAFDKVALTSKKKPLRISIDRVRVEKPKKEKPAKKQKGPPTTAPAPHVSSAGTAPANGAQDRNRVTVADANRALRRALDGIFSSGMDSRMIAHLPEYWQLYFKAVESHADYRPADPSVLRQNQVDSKAKLVSVFEPPSNDFAQKNGVAGLAMYHVIVGADGKPEQIVVGRPIGFGLDENAVAAIRKATFQPAVKGGKPVPVLVDLLVQFRIYSKRTGVASKGGQQGAGPSAPVLPGPYSVNRPKTP